MPYIILLVLVIAIVVIAARQQKFNHKRAQEKAQIEKEESIRTQEKRNSIEVNDYVEIKDEQKNE